MSQDLTVKERGSRSSLSDASPSSSWISRHVMLGYNSKNLNSRSEVASSHNVYERPASRNHRQKLDCNPNGLGITGGRSPQGSRWIGGGDSSSNVGGRRGASHRRGEERGWFGGRDVCNLFHKNISYTFDQ